MVRRRSSLLHEDGLEDDYVSVEVKCRLPSLPELLYDQDCGAGRKQRYR
jgi:hypothetical protein